MKNITLALAIVLGFCATEAEAQAMARPRRSLLGGRNRPAATVYKQPDIVLFDAKKAMPYADAVEKAKENDPEAYYWLSYYFSKGGEVNADGEVAWKFLLKSEELGWPEASLTMGRVHEFYSLKEGRSGYSEFSFIVDYSRCKHFENSSLTNGLVVACVGSFYDKALKGGVTDATNDLARLCKKRADAEARIEKEKEERQKAEEKKVAERLKAEESKRVRDENTAMALALLPPEKPEERVLREKNEAEEKAAHEQWSTWPGYVRWDDTNIIRMCEKELNVIYRRGSGWARGCGKAYIDRDRSIGDCCWKKFNSDGILIQAGDCMNFSEYIWMTNCAARVTMELRKKWSEEHGMSCEEAVRKVKKKYPPVKTARAEREMQAAERERQIIEALRKVCEAEKKQ